MRINSAEVTENLLTTNIRT